VIDFASDKVWLAAGATDMRKSIDGLAALAQHVIGQQPTSQQLFVFCSRDRSKVKILYWGGNGFWLLYKRLERGTFRWPKDVTVPVCVSRRQLAWLLDGLTLDQRFAHRPLDAQFFS
jgi:transposase